MAQEEATVPPRPGAAALRALGIAWVVVLVGLGAGAGVLQWLGPPAPPPVREAAVPAPAVPPAAAPASPAAPPPAVALPPVHGPQGPAPVSGQIAMAPRAPGAAVPPPDPALQEPSGLGDGSFLPRIAGGLAPMRAYAAGAPPRDARPRVAILLADFAMREADSEEAMKLLPPTISFAVSPYAPRPRPLAEKARAAGHEMFVSLPMEPRGYPLDDPGDRAMLTGATPERNAQALRWALSRMGGVVGGTGALGALRGERFAASAQMASVLEELGKRGLAYVDPRPEGKLPAVPGATHRAVDLVVDDPAVRTEIDAKLERLEQAARDRGSAIGLVSAPTPVAVERLAAWTALLAQRGVVLVPVTALLAPLP
jgi:polysaccharide deacetylase 2 family uncharacterized protein YibQ